ncbi:hypothetical protein F5Y15DRAFT_201317 [Xylariaceae sp. FL0016]|nr:hypothetical protein F5Y15DRAFT_201317 [Xylariaceae sp. FL0016]
MDSPNDISRKRPSPSEEERDSSNATKRQRTETLEPDSSLGEFVVVRPAHSAGQVVNQPTAGDLGRDGLRRAIGLSLQHVGFSSCNTDAMEGFTEAVETYTSQFLSSLVRSANAARRSDPTPADYEATLRHFNLPLSTLKKHLKQPVASELCRPTFYDPITEDTSYLQEPRPYLGEELDGRQDKEERKWIPKGFPAFPSKHSYKWTPVEQPARDPQKKRAEAEADAKKGDSALRRLDRAAKISKHKELGELAERNPLSSERRKAWENLMRVFLPSNGSGNGIAEIADHSTIVNAGSKYGRKELPRTSRRAIGNAASSQN